jgi:hypothetical protein
MSLLESSMNISEERFQSIRDNSYKNFHAKGLDYICLYRSPQLTMKCYLFEGNLGSLPEIVVPHNHRYHFNTVVHAGRVRDRRFQESYESSPGALPYNCFDFYTPLNGGDGFHFVREQWLAPVSSIDYGANEHYSSLADGIHTLQIESHDAIAVLYQHEDVIPLDEPTQAFRFGDSEAPSLSGLYDRFSEDELVTRLHDLVCVGVVF